MKKDERGRPIGTFKCRACGEIWDGSQLYLDSMITAETWICGNLLYGAGVIKISDLPRNQAIPGSDQGG